MFKPQIIRRSFSLFARKTPASLALAAARNGQETIRIQRVRFIKPIITPRKLLKFALYTGTTYAALRFLLPLDEEDDEGHYGMAESEGTQGDQEAPLSIFLPTGFVQTKPSRPYRRSDPEYQDLAQIAKDPAALGFIKDVVAIHVRDVAAVNPSIKNMIGPIAPENPIHYYLTPVFPARPSPVYERPGIEVDEDLNVRRTTRPVSPHANTRFTNLAWPEPAAQAFYVYTKESAGKAYDYIKSRFFVGTGGQKQQSQGQVQDSRHSTSSPTSAIRSPGSPSSLGPSSETSAKGQALESSPAGSGAPRSSRTFLPTTLDPENLRSTLPAYMKSSIITMDMGTFRKNLLARTKHTAPLYVPAGAFVLEGLVTVHSAKGYAVIDVKISYHSRSNSLIDARMTLRNVGPLGPTAPSHRTQGGSSNNPTSS